MLLLHYLWPKLGDIQVIQGVPKQLTQYSRESKTLYKSYISFLFISSVLELDLIAVKIIEIVQKNAEEYGRPFTLLDNPDSREKKSISFGQFGSETQRTEDAKIKEGYIHPAIGDVYAEMLKW